MKARWVIAAMVVQLGGAVTACGDGGSAASTSATSAVPPTEADASSTTASTSTSTDPATTAALIATTAVPTTATQPAPPTTVDPKTIVDADVARRIASMDLRTKLAMLVFVGFNTGYGGNAGSTSPEAFEAVVNMGVGGVFIGRKEVNLFGAPPVVAASNADLPLLIATDGEGGRVDIWADLAEPLPPAAEMGRLDGATIETMSAAHGSDLRALGVNVNFAPMLDIAGGPNPLGDRTWGDTVEEVVAGTTAFSRGMCASGVWPTFKHFPGHGRSDYDADIRPATTPPWDEMSSFDVEPFRQLVDLFGSQSLIMSGHIDVPGLTSEGRPFSLDPPAMAQLRADVGFDGVIVTDELAEMGAITMRDLSIPEAASQAVAAGNDMLLFFGGPTEITAVIDRLAQDVESGATPVARIDEAVGRILRLRLSRSCSLT